MARVGRFRKGRASAQEFSPGSDFNYSKKVWKIGQNRFRIVGDIVLKWAIWVDAQIEGVTRRLPIFTNGPDPDGPGYFDPETDEATAEPRPHFLCKMVARMMASADPQVKDLGEEMEPQPVFYANVIDEDDADFHGQTKHTKLACNHEKGNTFSRSIADGIEEQLEIQGSQENPADWETHKEKGLVFVVTKKVKGGNTNYSVTAMLADAALTEEQAAYQTYDLEKEVAGLTPVAKIKEWLGEAFLKEHGVTEEEMAAQAPFCPERSSKGKTDNAGHDGKTTTPATSSAPVASTTAPPSEPSEPSEPSAPSEPSEPSAPDEPAAPEDPAQKRVDGPEGDLLPPGILWKPSGNGTPFFWHVSDDKKTGWKVEDVVPQ